MLARRLAETGASVILVEAGGSDRTMWVRKPGLIAVFHSIPQLKQRLDWGFYSAPQADALGRRIPQTRGKVLGGSGSVNGMVFVRGNRENYDGWAADGCPGWAYDDVLPSFRRMETWEDGASELRGGDGPIRVTRAKEITPATQAFIEALADTAGVKKNDDYNGETQEGAALFQQSADGGLRYSSSVGYLDGHGLPNLSVVTGSLVTRVLISGGRASGVALAGGGTIRASREVILTAGAFGSAQLLMLSGVGPAGHLREHGIEVAADLPVGDNLHDHMFVPMSFLMKSARNRGTAPYFAAGMLKESLRGGTWVSRSVFEGVGFIRSPHAGSVPDLQIHALPWGYPGPNQDAPIRHKVDPRPSLTLLATLIYPKSRGTLRLASADPAAAPVIDPAYLHHPDDRRLLLDGIELIRDVMANKIIADGVGGEVSPGPDYPDRDAMAAELPNRATTVYHPVGTCRMGSDERAVVDPSLRVLGIEGLRVADASIMPSIVGGNTNAAAMMIGEHCANLMKA
ncbi:choline dehydrogenase [Acrocarpospora phusangensis]|uniref:Choline dehydrogenase n=1 Tax=Acrocarpospora phusangensis TaxID=1070424 RepID=A0A919UPL4_9ACTN|nr:choline dehydrogenase [Acrocarpospora phusangensis]